MSIVTNIKIRTTALCCHYGSIADIVDPTETKKIHAWEGFVTKLRVIFIILPMILMCFFALLSEIRYAALHCCSWLLPAKSKIILLDGLKGTCYN